MTAGPTSRATVRIRPHRASYDRNSVWEVFDQAWICHVGIAGDGGPMVIPMTPVRIGDSLLLHGSPANRILRALRQGAEACIEATIVDGLVLGGSPLGHSLNYRSAVAYGRLRELQAVTEKRRAAAALLDRLAPGRRRQMRPLTAAELEHTSFLSMELQEASVKTRNGMPDPDADADPSIWAGVIPLTTVALSPRPSAETLKALGPGPHPAPVPIDALPGQSRGPGRSSQRD